MADEPSEQIDDNELVEDQDDAAVEAGGSDDDAGADDGEIVIEIEGDEAKPEDESKAIRELREANRRQARELADLRAQTAPKPIEVGKKPDLWEDCDGDTDRFEAELLAYNERKRKADSAEQEKAEADRKTADLWNGIESNYRDKAKALAVPNFEQKEQLVDETLPDLVRRGIKAYCVDPAKVYAALGTNAALLDKIAKEPDPIKQLLTLAKLEDKMTVKRTREVAVDKPYRGSASIAAGDPDKKLAELEKEAERTGDRTKVVHYKAAMKAKAA